MKDSVSDEARWSTWLVEAVDPLVHKLLTLDDPRDAYLCANDVVGALNGDYLTDSAQGGGVYVTWAELTDVFETGKTPDAVAHDLLRSAARRWLDRDGPPTYAFQERWVGETDEQTRAAFSRDGDFWRDPSDT